jgi:hypothetical protein
VTGVQTCALPISPKETLHVVDLVSRVLCLMNEMSLASLECVLPIA